jgi:cytochrome b
MAEPRRDPDRPLSVSVWDPVVRIFHWSLVLSMGIAWLSTNSFEDLHSWAGYVAGALIALRLLWGFIGTRYARFVQFVKPPRSVLEYLRAMAAGREARYLGHNPAGGAMIVVLIIAAAATAISGWMLTTDAFWGVAWAQRRRGDPGELPPPRKPGRRHAVRAQARRRGGRRLVRAAVHPALCPSHWATATICRTASGRCPSMTAVFSTATTRTRAPTSGASKTSCWRASWQSSATARFGRCDLHR